MNNINTPQREADIQKAKLMGEDFAKLRSDDLLAQFLCETGIIDDLYEDYKDRVAGDSKPVPPERFLELLKKDYGETFKRVVSAAYSIGHLDKAEQMRTSLYRPKKENVQQGEKPSQLILPGME